MHPQTALAARATGSRARLPLLAVPPASSSSAASEASQPEPLRSGVTTLEPNEGELLPARELSEPIIDLSAQSLSHTLAEQWEAEPGCLFWQCLQYHSSAASAAAQPAPLRSGVATVDPNAGTAGTPATTAALAESSDRQHLFSIRGCGGFESVRSPVAIVAPKRLRHLPQLPDSSTMSRTLSRCHTS